MSSNVIKFWIFMGFFLAVTGLLSLEIFFTLPLTPAEKEVKDEVFVDSVMQALLGVILLAGSVGLLKKQRWAYGLLQFECVAFFVVIGVYVYRMLTQGPISLETKGGVDALIASLVYFMIALGLVGSLVYFKQAGGEVIVEKKREDSGISKSWLFAGLFMTLLSVFSIGFLFAIPFEPKEAQVKNGMFALFSVFFLLSILFLVGGIGLLKKRRWAFGLLQFDCLAFVVAGGIFVYWILTQISNDSEAQGIYEVIVVCGVYFILVQGFFFRLRHLRRKTKLER